MSEVLKNLCTIICVILGTMILGEVVVLINKGLKYVSNKVDEVQTTTKLAQYNAINLAIDSVQDIVKTVVTSINQTVVDGLKECGNWNEITKITTKEQAVECINKLLTDDLKTAIKTIYGDLDVYIDKLIESTVKELKTKC